MSQTNSAYKYSTKKAAITGGFLFYPLALCVDAEKTFSLNTYIRTYLLQKARKTQCSPSHKQIKKIGI